MNAVPDGYIVLGSVFLFFVAWIFWDLVSRHRCFKCGKWTNLTVFKFGDYSTTHWGYHEDCLCDVIIYPEEHESLVDIALEIDEILSRDRAEYEAHQKRRKERLAKAMERCR